MYFVKVRGNLHVFYMIVTIQSLKHNKQNIHVVTSTLQVILFINGQKINFYIILVVML